MLIVVVIIIITYVLTCVITFLWCAIFIGRIRLKREIFIAQNIVRSTSTV